MFGTPTVKICCGPRCGTEPNHRAICDATENGASACPVVPTMCRGVCGGGVTLVLPDGTTTKARDPEEARAAVQTSKTHTASLQVTVIVEEQIKKCLPSRY
jgi:hypothetical protein